MLMMLRTNLARPSRHEHILINMFVAKRVKNNKKFDNQQLYAKTTCSPSKCALIPNKIEYPSSLDFISRLTV